jgi:hypothetical protein
MQVLHYLSALLAAVYHQPVAFPGDALLLRQVFRDLYHFPGQFIVVIGYVSNSNDMPGRDYQDVGGGNRVDIPKRQYVFITIDDIGGNIAGDYFTEYAVFHVKLPDDGFSYDNKMLSYLILSGNKLLISRDKKMQAAKAISLNGD